MGEILPQSFPILPANSKYCLGLIQWEISPQGFCPINYWVGCMCLPHARCWGCHDEPKKMLKQMLNTWTRNTKKWNVRGTNRDTYLWIICYAGSLANVISFNHRRPRGGNLISLNLIWKRGQSCRERTFFRVANCSRACFTEVKKWGTFYSSDTKPSQRQSWHLLILLCTKCFTKIPFNPSSTLWVRYVPRCPNDGTKSMRGFITWPRPHSWRMTTRKFKPRPS